MATIIKRGEGWQAKIRKKGWPIQSKTFPNYADAETWAKLTEADMLRGTFINRAEAERNTIGDLVDKYREEILPGLAGRGTAPALGMIEMELGKYSLAGLTSKRVAEYRDKRLKAVSPESVRKELSTLSKMIDTAIKEWGIIIPLNPVKAVKRPSPGKARDRRLLSGEQERIEAALKQCRSPYMLPLFRFALETAARQGELLSIRRPHLDKQRRLVMLYDTKNGEDRATPLSSTALAILEGLPSKLKDDRVFPISQGLVVQAWGHAIQRARRDYEKELRKAGKKEDDIAADPLLLDLTFHDLRHEALSRLAERGDLSVIELASISGHKTLQMLKRYTHLQAENIAKKLG